jgi:hypothetical protein
MSFYTTFLRGNRRSEIFIILGYFPITFFNLLLKHYVAKETKERFLGDEPLLRCESVVLVRWFPTFRRNLIASSSKVKKSDKNERRYLTPENSPAVPRTRALHSSLSRIFFRLVYLVISGKSGKFPNIRRWYLRDLTLFLAEVKNKVKSM